MAKKGITLNGKNDKVIGEVYAESHNKIILLNIEEPVSITEIDTITHILKSYRQKYDINLLRILTNWGAKKELVEVERSFIEVLIERIKPLEFSFIALVVSDTELLRKSKFEINVEVFRSATKADITLSRLALFENSPVRG